MVSHLFYSEKNPQIARLRYTKESRVLEDITMDGWFHHTPTFRIILKLLSRIVRHLRCRVETLEPYPLAYMWDFSFVHCSKGERENQ